MAGAYLRACAEQTESPAGEEVRMLPGGGALGARLRYIRAMASALSRLNGRMQALRGALADSELAWLRHATVDDGAAGRAAPLLGDEGRELYEEVVGRGEITAEIAQALGKQLAYVAYETARAPMRPRLATWLHSKIRVGSGVEQPSVLLAGLLRGGEHEPGQLRAGALVAALQPLSQRLCELREHSVEALRARWPVAIELSPRIERAEHLLRETDDAAGELVPWLLRSQVHGGDATYQALLAALRRTDLDGLARSQRRMHRLSAGFRALGFERDMNAHLHVEPAQPLLWPQAGVLARSVPGDVRIAQGTLEYGVLSDHYAAEGLGHALGLALVSPALSFYERMPVLAEVPRALGGLAMQLRADALYLRRGEGLPPSECEQLGRHAAILSLLSLRASASMLLATAATARNTHERLEHAVAALHRALRIDVPAEIAALAVWTTPPFGIDFQGRLCGLALHVGLRERYDEDWFRNPRAGEPLRGACVRGEAFDVRALCAELGLSLQAGVGRMCELLDRSF